MKKINLKSKENFIKYLSFFGGTGLSLFAVVLIMNVGVVARIFAFPFFFLFGAASYYLYLLLYGLGIFLLFKERLFKKIHFSKLFSFIFLGLGIMILFTYLSCSTAGVTISLNNGEEVVNFSDQYLSYFENLKTMKDGYLNTVFIDMFSKNHPFGGGYLGYLLTALLNDTIGNQLALGISISSIVIGVLLFILPYLINLIKKHKEGRVGEIGTKPKKISTRRVENISYIENANKVKVRPIHEDEIKPQPQSPIKEEVINKPSFLKEETPNLFTSINENKLEPKENVNVQTTIIGSGLAQNQTKNESHQVSQPQYVSYGVFIPAKYPFGGFKEEKEIAPSYESMVQSQPQINVKQPVQPVAQEVVQPKHVEQMTLDFEEKVERDERLVTFQPTYQAPIAVDRAPTNVTPNVNNINPNATNSEMAPNAKPRMKFIAPSIDLLDDYETSKTVEENSQVAEERLQVINEVFQNFRVGAKCISYTIGPSVTRFNIDYDANVSVTSVNKLINDICVRLGGLSARFEPIVAGQKYSGLEIPNAYTTTVSFKEIFSGLKDPKKHPLNVGFGKNISGELVSADFNEFPHMLVAGTTGSGKSVFVHSVIMSLIMRNSPDDLKLVLIDPKQVEMQMYIDMPHLLCPIITDPNEAKVALTKLTVEMDNRYTLFKEPRVFTISEYNEWAKENGKETLPYIIVFIDEYADLIDTCKDLSLPVVRISQKARACGIHLCIATQRPSTNVITGVIKSNLPTHVALMTSNYVDSMTIINEGGAEKLLGKGDMLVQSPLVSRVGCVRLQSPYVRSSEINRVVSHLVNNHPVNYNPEFLDLVDHSKEQSKNNLMPGGGFTPNVDPHASDDKMYEDIKAWAMCLDYCSMSKIQREFPVGFSRAGKMFKRLQDDGIVDSVPESASRGCKVLIKDKFFDEDNGTPDDLINTGE